MANKNVQEFTADNWDREVVQSDQPVVVDFWAPWCGPCRQLAPVIDRVADQYAGRVKVGKVNVDDHPALAGEYSITSIPRVYVFKGDRTPIHKITGATSVIELGKILDRALEV